MKRYQDNILVKLIHLSCPKATEKNPENIKKTCWESSVFAIVCITGKLKSFKTKKEVINLELQGFAVSKNLTIECDYLISEGLMFLQLKLTLRF